MNARKLFTVTTLIAAFVTSFPSTSQAEQTNPIQPTITYKTYSVPIGLPISSNDLQAISELNLTFKYSGAECKFKSQAGCTVIKSSNPMIPVGLVVKAIATRTNGSVASTAAFRAGCGWCSIAGDFLAITLFIYTAPASAPVALVVATYSIGIGIILGHA